MRKTAIRIIFGWVIICCVICGGVIFKRNKSRAEELELNKWKQFLDNNGITCEKVEIKENELVIRIKSEGKDRCTLEDVKSIGIVYDGLERYAYEDKISGITIQVEDCNQKTIYDYSVFDIPMKRMEEISPISEEEKEDIRKQLEGKIQDDCSVEVKNSEDLCNGEIEVIVYLDESALAKSTLYDCTSVYDEIVVLANRDNRIKKCNITFISSDGDVEVFIIGRLPYNTCVAWISPRFESIAMNNSH